MSDNGQQKDTRQLKTQGVQTSLDDFVLDKGIFSNIFEKDIRRIYIYKKCERLAKATHLITPAFRESPTLRNRVDAIAVGLVDAATLPPRSSRSALSRELLALSSVLAIARSAGLISPMNTDLIAREAHALLEEIATYEEPRLFLEEAPTLATLFKSVGSQTREHALPVVRETESSSKRTEIKDMDKGQSSTAAPKTGRREAILSVLRAKGPSYIKDISTVIRDVSEKTIQRELSTLVAEGTVHKTGERRWTIYSLPA